MPTDAVDDLWRAYEAFEFAGPNKTLAKRLVDEHRPVYQLVRTLNYDGQGQCWVRVARGCPVHVAAILKSLRLPRCAHPAAPRLFALSAMTAFSPVAVRSN